MLTKLQFTKKFIELIPNNDYTVDSAETWWVNNRNQGGFRLSRQGFKILTSALGLEYWTQCVSVEKPAGPINSKIILGLDRKLHWPYYIENNTVYFFSSKEAMLAKLYPDIESFLAQYERPDQLNN